jgi:hypothetical protein
MAVERPIVVAGQTLLAAGLIILPLIYTLVPPLEDYPNHLARIFALSSLKGNPYLSQFYEVEWAPIPNLIMDLVAPPLVPLVGIYAAGRIFLGSALLLMLTGSLVLHRAVHGRWSAWPLVGGIFVYNGFLFVGLVNYLFGVGLAIWGLAFWIMLAERQIVLRAGVSFAFCAALYVCHLSALGLYGLAIGAFETWRLWSSRQIKSRAMAQSLAALVLPALPFLWLLLHSPTWGLSGAIEWEAQGKLDALIMLLTVYSDLSDIPLLLLAAAAVYFGISRKLVQIHPAGLVVLIILSAAFLAMPRMAFGSWMADQRLLVGIFFFTLGFVSVDLRGPGVGSTFFALCLALIAFRIVDVSVNWSATSQPLLELKSSLRRMPPGSRLLVTQADEPEPESVISVALAHAPTLAVIERSALVSRLFVVPGKQVLHARPGTREHVDTEDGDTPTVSRVIGAAAGSAPEGPQYWDQWPKYFDYVMVLGTTPDDSANPAPHRLRMVHNGRAFQLYTVTSRD